MGYPILFRLTSLSLIVLTVICWAYQSMLVKLTKVFDAAWILWCVVTVSFVVFLTLLLIGGRSPLGPSHLSKKMRWVLVVEPCFEVLGYGCVFYAMQNVPLGDAVTIWDMDVIWTAILFSIIQRRCLSPIHIGCIVVAAVGIVLVCQPEFIFQGTHSAVYDGFPNLSLGYGTAFACSICFTFMFVFVALLQDAGVHWTVIEFNFVPLGFVILPFFTWMVNDWTPPQNVTSQNWIAALVIALLDILARLCTTFALQVEAPPLVALTASLEIPFSYLFAYIFAGESPNYLTAIGATLIFLCVLTMGGKDFWDERNRSKGLETDPLLPSENSNVESTQRRRSFAGRRVISPDNSIDVA